MKEKDFYLVNFFSLSSKREEEEKLHSHRSPSVVGRASHRRYVREDLLLLSISGDAFFLSGRPAPSPESGGSFSIGFAGFCLREEMASLASRSPALYLREEIASLASRSPALYLREGMAYLASRSPAFLRSTIKSASIVLLASLSKSQRTFSSTRLYVALESF
ncbi:LOW QUALITY PROTEIN: hypothetical protein YC2023_087818 [Brassica napus]